MTNPQKAQHRRQLQALAAELDDLQAEDLLTTWELWARPEQLDPGGGTTWLALAGRGWGKTRAGAEWVRDRIGQGFRYVNFVGPTAADVRDVMVQGESGVLAVCPRWERPTYHPSKRSLEWPSGAVSLLFSAEDPEQMRGPQSDSLWCDEIAAWSAPTRQEAWDLAMFGLRLGADPRVCATTTPKPVALLRTLTQSPEVVISKGTTYDNRANLAPSFLSQIITAYEGTRLGRQEILAELLLDEGLAYRVEQGVHIVPTFPIPEWWQRFESMDYGRNAPTAWPLYAVDADANVVVVDMYYSPGMVAEHAQAIHARRERWYPDEDSAAWAVCFGPPDIKTRLGVRDFKGRELTVESEFAEHGISFAPAQTDRRAGYARVEGMLEPDPKRVFPDWHPRAGQPGSPRVFILDAPALEPLISQLRDAPIEDPNSPLSRFPGEAVDAVWESAEGHAHAAVRYGLMSRPLPSEEPDYLAEAAAEVGAKEITRLRPPRVEERPLVVEHGTRFTV